MEIVQTDKLTRKCAFGKTDVFCGSGIVENIVPTLKTIFEDGAICLVYDRKLMQLQQRVAECLKNEGYRVFLRGVGHSDENKDKDKKYFINFESSSETAPEYVRYVFAIGAGSACDEAKRIAKQLSIGWSVLLSAPSTDSILTKIPPNQVFIDENVLLKCPHECIASGWGIVLSEPLKAFEEYFSRKVLSQDNVIIERRLQDLTCGADASALAVKLLEISFHKSGCDTAEIIAKLLYADAIHCGQKPRMLGEYKFVASSLLTAFYTSYLGAPSIDVIPPTSHVDVMDKICAFAPEWRNNDKKIDFFDINSYFRISYILSEYRLDLLDKLSGIDVHTTQRFWRRLYPDAGYWLKGTFTSRNLLYMLTLAGELSDGLLGFASAGGFTSRFVA